MPLWALEEKYGAIVGLRMYLDAVHVRPMTAEKVGRDVATTPPEMAIASHWPGKKARVGFRN